MEILQFEIMRWKCTGRRYHQTSFACRLKSTNNLFLCFTRSHSFWPFNIGGYQVHKILNEQMMSRLRPGKCTQFTENKFCVTIFKFRINFVIIFNLCCLPYSFPAYIFPYTVHKIHPCIHSWYIYGCVVGGNQSCNVIMLSCKGKTASCFENHIQSESWKHCSYLAT